MRAWNSELKKFQTRISPETTGFEVAGEGQLHHLWGEAVLEGGKKSLSQAELWASALGYGCVGSRCFFMSLPNVSMTLCG